MKVASWNVNGIRACTKNGFLDWLATKPVEIICLQEVRADVEQIPAEIIGHLHYTHQHWNAAERKGYSGVGILSQIKPELVIKGLDCPEFDCEGRVLTAVFKGFTVVTAYFPNSQSAGARLDYKVRFCERLRRFAEEFEKTYNQPVILNGDFNIAHREIDLARPKENEETAGYLPRERAWMDAFIGAGWTDSFRRFHPTATEQYSWWSARQGARPRNIGWRIDYNAVSPSGADKIKGAGIWQDVMGSDHCPVWIDFGL